MFEVVDEACEAEQVLVPALSELRGCRHVQAAHAAGVVAGFVLEGRDFLFKGFQDAWQFTRRHFIATPADHAGWCLEVSLAQAFEVELLLVEFAQFLQGVAEGRRIKRCDRGLQVSRIARRCVHLLHGLEVTGHGPPQIGAAIARVDEDVGVVLIEARQAFFHRRELGGAFRRGRRRDVLQHVARDVYAQGGCVREEFPGAAAVDLARDIVELRIVLAVGIGRMGRPHAGWGRDRGLEHAVGIGWPCRCSRICAIMRVGIDVAQVLQDPRLDHKDVGDGLACQLFIDGEIGGALHGVVGAAELVQRVDQCVAAAEGHRHEVGLELHLAGQCALREDNAHEQRVDQRAERPDHELECPADPRDAAAQACKKSVQRIAPVDDLRGHLLCDIDPAADCHGLLGEMAELMCEDGLEFAERQHVDEAKPDLEVLARRQDQVQQRKVIRHRCVDAR